MGRAEGQGTAAVLEVEEQRLYLGCNDSRVELLEVQMEGKKRMSAAEFLRGFQVKSGEQVGA